MADESNTCAGLRRVEIDGIRYIAESDVISEKTLRALGKAYSIAFGYGIYDADTNPEHLREIFRLLSEANQELKFKR